MTWLNELKIEDLHGDYADLFSVIGLELTAQVEVALGGGQLYLPQARHALKAAKERYVLANDKIHNRRLLSRDTGLSLRHVYRICEGKSQARRHDEDPRQLSLLPITG